jgi:hypothetical protein
MVFSELCEIGAENFSGAIHSTFPALVLRDVDNVLVVCICTINFHPGFSSADAPMQKHIAFRHRSTNVTGADQIARPIFSLMFEDGLATAAACLDAFVDSTENYDGHGGSPCFAR